MSEQRVSVEVAYALPNKQKLIAIEVPVGATVKDAIEQSGILALFPDIDLEKHHKVGVWSRVCALSRELNDGDRVEIYRPLIADPKEIRKRRAARAKQEGRADKITGGRPKHHADSDQH